MALKKFYEYNKSSDNFYRDKVEKIFNRREQIEVDGQWVNIETRIVDSNGKNKFFFRLEKPSMDEREYFQCLIDEKEMNISKRGSFKLSEEVISDLVDFVKKTKNYIKGSDAYPALLKYLPKLSTTDHVVATEKL